MSSPSRPIRVGVDVVVPIYNAREDVERCINSVLRHASGDWRLLLVDDCSTDAALVDFLKRAAEQHERVEYLRNEVNGGFVVTANRGMRAAAGRDVLLLNSDTIVTPRFIDKHIECVHADETTGIATPFTNNGTICSIPEFCRDNELPAELSVDEYAALVERVSPRSRPEIVTAIGFCMYVRGTVIEQIGYFDEEAFGRGFGEENDFCERAKQRGWTIRLVDDCFVAHLGKASFGDEGRELEHVNSRTLAKMHPNYFPDVAAFCAENPLQGYQDRIRFELGRQHMRGFPSALYVLHAPMVGDDTGGTEHFVRGLVASLALPRVVVAWPEDCAIVALEIDRGRIDKALQYRFELSKKVDFFCLRDNDVEAMFDGLLDTFDVRFAHIHHLIRWPVGIWRKLKARSIPYAFTIHDYYCVCPSWNLVQRNTGTICDCPASANPQQTRACVAAQYHALDMTAPSDAVSLVEAHRREFAELLEHAALVFAPSCAAGDVARRYHACAIRDVQVIGHGYETAIDINDAPLPPSRSTEGPVRVAILGQVAYPAKGSEVYVDLMLKTRDLPIEWHVFGGIEVFGYRKRLEALGLGRKLILHGDYQREQIVHLLRESAIDVTLILPHCAETFCFTLSESWLAGVPAIVTRMGALPERVAQTGAGRVVDSIEDVLEQLKQITANRSILDNLRRAAQAYRHATVQDNAANHRSAYGNYVTQLEDLLDESEVGGHDIDLFAAHRRHLEERRRGIERPRYQSKWWFAHYLRIKPLIPPGVRGAMKRAYLRMRHAGAARS